ncbi:MAG: general secretion pathway protein GspB [Gammaproteobacteria bacterium]|nr:general secretion pathway protein GspB [Gammaproteobacteria bacterium]
MSFILDALRKSENERQQQTAAPLAAMPRSTRQQSRNVWLPILIIVLACNALLAGYLLLGRSEPTSSMTAEAPEVRSLRKESIVPPPEPVLEKPPTPAIKAAPASKPPAPKPPVKKPIQDGLPNLAQLQSAGLVSVGELRVDMHVYAGETDKRFVFINMKKYKEGEKLNEGPTIEAITVDGIILVHQGNRFRLDRD